MFQVNYKYSFMEVKVSMSYLDDEKYSVKNVSGNELVVDMYARDKKENLSPMELLLSAVTLSLIHI